MGLDDLMSTESAVVAAATAAVFSPRTRETLRKGAVLGVAGALKVGDVVAGAAKGVARGVRGEDGDTEMPAPPAPTPRASTRTTAARRSTGRAASK